MIQNPFSNGGSPAGEAVGGETRFAYFPATAVSDGTVSVQAAADPTLTQAGGESVLTLNLGWGSPQCYRANLAIIFSDKLNNNLFFSSCKWAMIPTALSDVKESRTVQSAVDCKLCCSFCWILWLKYDLWYRWTQNVPRQSAFLKNVFWRVFRCCLLKFWIIKDFLSYTLNSIFCSISDSFLSNMSKTFSPWLKYASSNNLSTTQVKCCLKRN